ncbi:MAG: hypothetical protein NZ651_06275 [Candidatus Bipolaricaulota bacterium]|nr:hypothetical protein [Candidatus Bipolaricaulota bacterium]MDW8127360.1 hypothetical protein [Candidatus Bipolaricaulota bacterium]
MRAFTFNEVRDIVAEKLKEIFPELWPYRVLDYSALQRYRGRDFLEVELPVVTYSLQFRPHFERVVDYKKIIYLDQNRGIVQELVPYIADLALACHSDVQAEAEELALRVHQKLGRAPCLGGIGFHLVRSLYGGAVELQGIYSILFAWEGWFRLAGPTAEAGLIHGHQFTVIVLPEIRPAPETRPEPGTYPEPPAPPGPEGKPPDIDVQEIDDP